MPNMFHCNGFRTALKQLHRKSSPAKLQRGLGRRSMIAVGMTLFLLTPCLSAQIDTGTIVGSVVDPSGAVIASATVTVRDEAEVERSRGI